MDPFLLFPRSKDLEIMFLIVHMYDLATGNYIAGNVFSINDPSVNVDGPVLRITQFSLGDHSTGSKGEGPLVDVISIRIRSWVITHLIGQWDDRWTWI